MIARTIVSRLIVAVALAVSLTMPGSSSVHAQPIICTLPDWDGVIAARADSAPCWGTNQQRQLGEGNNVSSRTTHAQVAGGLKCLELHAGNNHTRSPASTGDAHYWV